MLENNLKPCPLCGSTENLMVYKEQISNIKNKKDETGIVSCTTPNCPMVVRASTVEEAVKKWNKRPLEDALYANLEIAKDAIERAKEEIEDNPDLTISLFYLILRDALQKLEEK